MPNRRHSAYTLCSLQWATILANCLSVSVYVSVCVCVCVFISFAIAEIFAFTHIILVHNSVEFLIAIAFARV